MRTPVQALPESEYPNGNMLLVLYEKKSSKGLHQSIIRYYPKDPAWTTDAHAQRHQWRQYLEDKVKKIFVAEIDWCRELRDHPCSNPYMELRKKIKNKQLLCLAGNIHHLAPSAPEWLVRNIRAWPGLHHVSAAQLAALPKYHWELCEKWLLHSLYHHGYFHPEHKRGHTPGTRGPMPLLHRWQQHYPEFLQLCELAKSMEYFGAHDSFYTVKDTMQEWWDRRHHAANTPMLDSLDLNI